MRSVCVVAAVFSRITAPVAPTLLSVLGLSAAPVSAVEGTRQYPAYKPASRSPEPIDIRANAYGASRSAPHALGIGDRVPDFAVPRARGGDVTLDSVRAQGAVVIIFYRGHW